MFCSFNLLVRSWKLTSMTPMTWMHSYRKRKRGLSAWTRDACPPVRSSHLIGLFVRLLVASRPLRNAALWFWSLGEVARLVCSCVCVCGFTLHPCCVTLLSSCLWDTDTWNESRVFRCTFVICFCLFLHLSARTTGTEPQRSVCLCVCVCYVNVDLLPGLEPMGFDFSSLQEAGLSSVWRQRRKCVWWVFCFGLMFRVTLNLAVAPLIWGKKKSDGPTPLLELPLLVREGIF